MDTKTMDRNWIEIKDDSKVGAGQLLYNSCFKGWSASQFFELITSERVSNYARGRCVGETTIQKAIWLERRHKARSPFDPF